MASVPAPDFSNHTIQQLFDELHSGMVGSPVHQQAMFMLQFRLAEKQTNSAKEQAAAAAAMVEPTKRLATFTGTLATATKALFIVACLTLLGTMGQGYLTNQYVKLTDKLLKVQIDPIVGFDLTDLGSDTVEVWNDGFDPVLAMRINPEIVAFTGATPTMQYRSSVAPGRKRNDWWKIDRLSPGDPSQRKSIAELAQRWQGQLIDKQKSGTTLIKDKQRAAIIFRITYHREADKRQFSATKIIIVDEGAPPSASKLLYSNLDLLKWVGLSGDTEQQFLREVDRLSRVP
jgi:hypothetical protein